MYVYIYTHTYRCLGTYRGTSLTRKRTPLGPYRRPMPRVLGGSEGVGRFLMSKVPLYGGPMGVGGSYE